MDKNNDERQEGNGKGEGGVMRKGRVKEISEKEGGKRVQEEGKKRGKGDKKDLKLWTDWSGRRWARRLMWEREMEERMNKHGEGEGGGEKQRDRERLTER